MILQSMISKAQYLNVDVQLWYLTSGARLINGNLNAFSYCHRREYIDCSSKVPVHATEMV